MKRLEIVVLAITLIFLGCNKKSSRISQDRFKNDSLVSIIDSLKEINNIASIKYRSLSFLSNGTPIDSSEAKNDADCYLKYYRAEIFTSEIYCSLKIEKMCSWGEGAVKIIKEIHISIEKECHISEEQTNDLHFVKWITNRSFEFAVNQKTYQLTLDTQDNYKIVSNENGL